jgi:hypothetical protein
MNKQFKLFLSRLLFIVYMLITIGILLTAMIWIIPVLLEVIPLWTCLIVYPITLIVVASMNQTIRGLMNLETKYSQNTDLW